MVSSRILPRFIFPIVTVVGLLMVMTGQSSLVKGQSASMSATEILERASARIADTETLNFALEVDGPTFVDADETIQLLEATGELVRPDSVHSRFKVKVLNSVTVTMEIITIGEKTWSTDLITGDWGEAPIEFAYNPSMLFDTEDGVGPVMDRVVEEERLDDEEIRDRDVYRVEAVVARDVIGPLTSNTLTGAPISVELWIDQITFDLLRAKLSETATEEEDPAVWTLDLDDHDKDFKIEPPDTGD